MSATVDLLPPEIGEARTQRRVLQALAGAFVVLLLALAVVQVVQLRRVDAAVAVQEAEEARLAQLRAEVAGLSEFGLVAAELETAELQLVAALASEVGMAAILQDLAAVMPSDANVDGVTLTVDPDGAEAGSGALPQTVATLQLSGETRRGVAPGVERLLVSLDKVAAFQGAELGSTTMDEAYARFEVGLDVDTNGLTGRYLDGIPEELR